MGVPEYKINSSIRAVLAQRLIRKVCPHCSVKRPISSKEGELINLKAGTQIRFATILSSEEMEKRKQEGTICHACKGAGYNGRIGTYEFLPLNREIQLALKEKRSDIEIQNIAVANGMLTLTAYGVELIKSELTTISEVIRVCKS